MGCCLSEPTGSTAVAFSANGELVAVAAPDGVTRLWETRTGRALGTVDKAGRLAFSGDGRWLLVGAALIDVASLRPVGPPVARFVTFSSDGAGLLWAASGQHYVHPLADADLAREACERAARQLTLEEWERHGPAGSHRATCGP